MKRFIIICLILLGIANIASAQSLEDKRRIEEEKRTELAPSESYAVKIKKVDPQNLNFPQKAYFSELLSKKVARLSDGYKTLVILMGMADRLTDTDSQWRFLNKEGIIPKSIFLTLTQNHYTFYLLWLATCHKPYQSKLHKKLETLCQIQNN